jgi:selenocysteine lyase/cysteine desulfurase
MGEIIHNLKREKISQIFNRPEPMSFEFFYGWERREENRNPHTIRISVGIAPNFADIYRFMTFLQSLMDTPYTSIDLVDVEYPKYRLSQDSA